MIHFVTPFLAIMLTGAILYRYGTPDSNHLHIQWVTSNGQQGLGMAMNATGKAWRVVAIVRHKEEKTVKRVHVLVPASVMYAVSFDVPAGKAYDEYEVFIVRASELKMRL
jgi:hypothetical protein